LWKFIEDWKKVFDHFDADHSGMIDRKELADVLLAKFGWTLSPAVLDQMQRTFGEFRGIRSFMPPLLGIN
jgi:Ca2+-binding EF-hand superfamily protein